MDGQLKSFRDLKVWQKAVDLAACVYSVTEKFPKSELYGITNQMRRAAVSISSNIAEGFKRNHSGEKLQFYNVAYSSSAELESQIEVSRKLHFLQDNDYQGLNTSVVEIGKMMDGLMKSQSRSPKSYILSSIFFFLFLSSIFYILNPSPVSAAQFMIETDRSAVAPGSELTAKVNIDTEGETLNAFEGELLFPKDLLEISNVREGSSIVTVWLDKPKLIGSSLISFSGITPGGFRGEHGFLFSVAFRAKAEGVGLLALQSVNALKNDGSATPARVSIVTPHFTVSKKTPTSAPLEIVDTTPPEPFKLEIIQNTDAFSGKNVLVFLAQDKQSGVEHYDVCEGLFAPCFRAESPYVLKRQGADAFIVVRAVDQFGNVRIARLSTGAALFRYSLYGFLAILGIIIVLYAVSRRGKGGGI